MVFINGQAVLHSPVPGPGQCHEFTKYSHSRRQGWGQRVLGCSCKDELSCADQRCICTGWSLFCPPVPRTASPGQTRPARCTLPTSSAEVHSPVVSSTRWSMPLPSDIINILWIYLNTIYYDLTVFKTYKRDLAWCHGKTKHNRTQVGLAPACHLLWPVWRTGASADRTRRCRAITYLQTASTASPWSQYILCSQSPKFHRGKGILCQDWPVASIQFIFNWYFLIRLLVPGGVAVSAGFPRVQAWRGHSHLPILAEDTFALTDLWRLATQNILASMACSAGSFHGWGHPCPLYPACATWVPTTLASSPKIVRDIATPTCSSPDVTVDAQAPPVVLIQHPWGGPPTISSQRICNRVARCARCVLPVALIEVSIAVHDSRCQWGIVVIPY